jgi:hypothetical protein
MPRDILSEYGPESNPPQKAGAKSGGVKEAKPLKYSEPTGRKNMDHEGPGIHGTNHTNCGTQGRH